MGEEKDQCALLGRGYKNYGLLSFAADWPFSNGMQAGIYFFKKEKTRLRCEILVDNYLIFNSFCRASGSGDTIFLSSQQERWLLKDK